MRLKCNLEKLTKVKIFDSKKIYSGNISLKVDTFKLNENMIKKEVVEHPPSVGVIPLLDEDFAPKILLVTQYRHAVRKTTLEIPAGKIERGESPKKAALREMAEEIGYTGKLSPILKWNLAPGYSTELMHVYVATNLKKIKRQKLDDDENIIVKHMRLTTAIQKCFSGEISDCKTIAALLAYSKLNK